MLLTLQTGAAGPESTERCLCSAEGLNPPQGGGAEQLRFTGDNWLPEQLAIEANQSLIIACQLLRDSAPPIGYLH